MYLKIKYISALEKNDQICMKYNYIKILILFFKFFTMKRFNILTKKNSKFLNNLHDQNKEKIGVNTQYLDIYE